MYSPSGNWIEQVKHVVNEMMKSKSFVLEGIVSSVDPSPPYKVKVTLQPYEIETGWLKLMTLYAGNGFGLILPPPDEGTPVKVIFDMGDIKNGTVIGAVFNSNVAMPILADPGDAALVHKSGSKITIAKDGTVTLSSIGTVNVNAASVNLGGSGGAAIARAGDAVQVNTTTGIGTITAGSPKVKST